MIDMLRKAVRPVMLVMLAIMIGPVALVVGMAEAILPGAGVGFANGFVAYLGQLPESFWLFAGSAYGFYTVARSFGTDKRGGGDDIA